MLGLFIQIHGQTDSRAIYERLKAYDFNVTDCGETTLIYGQAANIDTARNVIAYCLPWGDLTINVSHDKSEGVLL